MTVDFTLAGGAPTWADGPSIPSTGRNPHFAWKPSAKDYGQFVRAVGQRYSGSFTPHGQSSALPPVHFWALWNEPNFGEDLGPQAINGSRVSYAPLLYRNLVDAGWSALHATGHGRDKILIGEFAARGNNFARPRPGAPQGLPGNFGQTKPLQFIRTLYCLDANYHKLRGAAAKSAGCPTSARASRRFRAQHPGLFKASGVGDHPYPDMGSPLTDGKSDPNFAAFPDLGRLEKELDKVNHIYGSGKKYSIYNDEYGYITDPPVPPGKHHYVSPTTAAYYLNWAEYLSWKSGRIASTMQYLLQDPGPTAGIYSGFASGLYFFSGQPKQPVLDAYRLPLYLPKTSLRRGKSAEVWGDLRPGHFMSADGHQPQTVAIQFQSGGQGAFTTVKSVTIGGATGYFDQHLGFGSSGNVRLAYTYPAQDTFLPVGVAGTTITSRPVAIKVH